MRFGAADFVECVRGCDQYLLRHAAAIGARAAKQIGLDHRDTEARLSRRHGHTHSGVAAAEYYDVEAPRGHASIPSQSAPGEDRTGLRWRLLFTDFADRAVTRQKSGAGKIR